MYLTLEGYRARYLTDGMLGIADQLRGDKARDYMARVATGTKPGRIRDCIAERGEEQVCTSIIVAAELR